MSVEDDARLGNGLCSIAVQLADGNNALQPSPTAGIGMYHVHLAVFVPQGTGINDALAGLYQYWFAPGAFRVFGLHHVGTAVGVTPEDIELSIVVTYAGRPYTVTVVGAFGCFKGLETVWYGGTDNGPVHQVLGMQYLQAGQTVEARRSHVEVVAYAAGVRVGVVGIEHGVLIGSVAPVGNPYFRYIVCILRCNG